MSSRKPPEPPPQLGFFDKPPLPAKPSPPGDAETKTWQVHELVRAVARTVEARFALVYVEGEISNLRAQSSGHLYFTLKDDDAQLPAVMFRSDTQRLKFRPQDGMRVRARGRLSIYDAAGKFQMYADGLEPAGMGAQQVAFELLKRKLQAEGLFDPQRKRPLPRWPKRVGLCTSPTGAAVRDIIRVAERRGRVRLTLSPCQVQGDGASYSIVAALQLVCRQPGVDVIILGRGGGSSEDLAAFNDEALARTIAACPVPIVSAVGHEVDFTIADFVADARAATPSQAAELVVPDFAQLEALRREVHARLLRAGRRTIGDARQRLDSAEQRAAQAVRQVIARRRRALDADARRLASRHPRARLHADRAALAALRARLASAGQRLLDGRRRAFAGLLGKLDALSPLAVLERGYSLTRTPEGHVITEAAEVKPGDEVRVRLLRGELQCRVQSVDPGDHEP
jgi:exodeoxyribonuclease VII large subunit